MRFHPGCVCCGGSCSPSCELVSPYIINVTLAGFTQLWGHEWTGLFCRLWDVTPINGTFSWDLSTGQPYRTVLVGLDYAITVDVAISVVGTGPYQLSLGCTAVNVLVGQRTNLGPGGSIIYLGCVANEPFVYYQMGVLSATCSPLNGLYSLAGIQTDDIYGNCGPALMADNATELNGATVEIYV